MPFSVEKYLNRIKYSGNHKVGLDLLKALQKNHLLHIPFENLDIHYPNPIILDVDRLYQKIVLRRRGGFCYELNGLFYELLIALGFEVRRISAQVYDDHEKYSEPYDHLTLIVRMEDQEYLVDVGFGEFTFAPLRLDPGLIQHDQRGDFLIDTYQDDYIRVNKIEDGKPVPKFIFKNIACEFDEFNARCAYHQTDDHSHFKQKRMISRPTEDGRITLSGNLIKITTGQKSQEIELEDEHSFQKELWNWFGIKL